VQDVLGQQLDDTDTEAVMNEFAAMEAAALDEELDKMPAVPTAAAAGAEAAGAEEQPAAAVATTAAADQGTEDELPSVPTTKVRAYSAQSFACFAWRCEWEVNHSSQHGMCCMAWFRCKPMMQEWLQGRVQWEVLMHSI
jgi:cell pole-organizing protein PopZ